jgi:hypothetical protein
MPIILDSRLLQFTVTLADAYSSMLRELHLNPSSGASTRSVVKEDYEHSLTSHGKNCPAQGEKSVLRTTMRDDTNTVKNTAQCSATEKEGKINTAVRI